jgi:3-oxoacyl-[acyl-carrier protein] reductase
MKLQNKVAIVAGGGRDIGRAVSLRLARDGAKVFVIYFDDPERSKDTVETINRSGGKAVLHHADLTKTEDIAAMAKAAVAAFGERIDILVNVTGGMIARKPLAEFDERFVETVLAVNFKSTVFTIQALAPYLGRGSAIVNFSSQAGRDGGGPGSAMYAASKGAIITFTRSMAKELAPRGVRVNAVCPGMISTLFHDIFTKPEVRAKVATSTPLGREGNADEIAAIVSFLASDDASFVTGACLDCNGGTLFS